MTERGDFVDPKTFLSQAENGIGAALIPTEPTAELLKWATGLNIETGYIFQEGRFIVVRGFYDSIPWYMMPEDSDILIHTHTGAEVDDISTPSINDFLTASPIAVNLIACQTGLTRFWKVPGQKERTALINFAQSSDYAPGKLGKLREKLTQTGARYEFTPWEELANRSIHSIYAQQI